MSDICPRIVPKIGKCFGRQSIRSTTRTFDSAPKPKVSPWFMSFRSAINGSADPVAFLVYLFYFEIINNELITGSRLSNYKKFNANRKLLHELFLLIPPFHSRCNLSCCTPHPLTIFPLTCLFTPVPRSPRRHFTNVFPSTNSVNRLYAICTSEASFHLSSESCPSSKRHHNATVTNIRAEFCTRQYATPSTPCN